MHVAQGGRRLYIYNKNYKYEFFLKRTKMSYKKLKSLLEEGEDFLSPISGIIGDISGIFSALGIGRRKQIRQQKEMAENAAQINYKYGEMAARNAFERQQVLYNRTYQDQSYASQVAQMDAAGLSPSLMYSKGGAGGGGAGSTTGAPMGATGAVGAGIAADPNARLQALMSLRQVRMSERKNEAEVNLLNTLSLHDALPICFPVTIQAENAFERQQVLYNRTYQDQSYANKVAQMDAAGLSPGLMYGGDGASGGGAGSTTGAPMGATGAAGAGSAADPNAQLQALMSLRQVRMSERKNEAEINLLKLLF